MAGGNDLWPEDPRGGDVVPLARGADGKLHWSWPNAIRGAVNDVHDLMTGPSDALAGRIAPNEMGSRGTRMAMTMLGLGLGVPAEANALHMFGGMKAKTADMPKLGQALTLEGRGTAPQEIHAATGWFRGPEGKWRFEIPDSAAALHGQNIVNGKLDIGRSQVYPLDDVLHHEDLFDAYPHLKNTRVSGALTGPGTAAYHPALNEIKIAPDQRQAALSTMLHEVQHGIQEHEGFAEGGGPEMFLPSSYYNRKLINDQAHDALVPKLQEIGVDPDKLFVGMSRFSSGLPLGDAYGHLKTLINKHPDAAEQYRGIYNTAAELNKQRTDAFSKYKSLAGENEAFMVQDRHASGDHSSFPPSTPGALPYDKQLVVLDGQQQPQLSFKGYHGTPHTFEPVDHNPFGEFRDAAIGSGEGAQVYGHGHYVAGARETAEEYAKNLSRPDVTYKGKSISGEDFPEHINEALQTVGLKQGNIDGTLNWLERGAKSHSPHLQEAYDWLKNNRDDVKYHKTGGNLLHLEIKPDEHELLDWEKPLAEQHPQVQSVVRPLLQEGLERQYKAVAGQNPTARSSGTATMKAFKEDLMNKSLDEVANRMSGGEIYRRLGVYQPEGKTGIDEISGNKFASDLLHKAGVPGIKYLDQLSRAPGVENKTSNYVIFDPSNIRITGRNDQMLPASGLEPVEHDPWAHVAEPVDHDPFATQE